MILSDDLFFTWCDSTIEFVTGFNVEFVTVDPADADSDADVADNADADAAVTEAAVAAGSNAVAAAIGSDVDGCNAF